MSYQRESVSRSRIRGRMLMLLAAAGIAVGAGGCVERTITINSNPGGALVWLNDREIGRTPVTVRFTYYGTYDVVLVKEGYEPLVTTGNASAPLWDVPPLDLGADLMPFKVSSDLVWDYELQPQESDVGDLIERGRAMRERMSRIDESQGDQTGGDDEGG